MSNVKEERTGWRDEKLSARHRLWGWDCPAIDLDFLMVEYNHGKPSAIVEYKNEHAEPQYRAHPSYQAIIALGDCSNIPVIAARYADDFSWWKVTPLNSAAYSLVPQQKTINEEEWVTILYQLRGLRIPENVLATIRGNYTEII